MNHGYSRRNMGVGAMLLGAAALAFLPPSMASAQTGTAPAGAKSFPTLDGKPPLILGHRCLPGLIPEETEASYDLAAALGTDALEETAYMADLWVASEKPLVFTAAMRNNSEMGADGPRNILASVRVASCPGARGAGNGVRCPSATARFPSAWNQR